MYIYLLPRTALVNLTYENPGNAVYIVDLLERRLRENSWIVRNRKRARKKEKEILILYIDNL
jgi:hypothetical protein